MKTVVLFHRLELTDLFAPVARALEGKVRVVHLAYGREEADRLRSLGVEGHITIFKDEVRRLYPTTQATEEALTEVDALFIHQSGGAFNLNGAIQSDRAFTRLAVDEAYRLTITYRRFWVEFLEKHEASIVVHETCSLMFNFMAAMVCAERGGHYLYAIMAHGPDQHFCHLWMSGFDFTCPELQSAVSAVRTGAMAVATRECAQFLEDYRRSFSVFLGAAFKPPAISRLAAGMLVREFSSWLFRNPYDRVLESVDHWQHDRRVAAAKFRNVRRYVREVKFDRFETESKFFFYPLHLEPEAVVLYHAHGLYANQVKLVQNIAAQLPPGVLLYVKDHPHDHGYRSADDYLALKSVPNIRLLECSVPGKEITAHSLGVITLTGTAGFEALLLGKPVFTFGKTFYSSGPGVEYVRNIRDLREKVYSVNSSSAPNEAQIAEYLTAYFSALHTGLTDYFSGRAQRYGIDLQRNAKEVARGLFATMQALERA